MNARAEIIQSRQKMSMPRRLLIVSKVKSEPTLTGSGAAIL